MTYRPRPIVRRRPMPDLLILQTPTGDETVMAKSKANREAELLQEVIPQVQAQLQTSPPDGAQAGLADLGKKLRKVIEAVGPGVVKGVFAAGLDGTFTPAEIAGIVADTVRRIMEARAAGDAVPAA